MPRGSSAGRPTWWALNLGPKGSVWAGPSTLAPSMFGLTPGIPSCRLVGDWDGGSWQARGVSPPSSAQASVPPLAGSASSPHPRWCPGLASLGSWGCRVLPWGSFTLTPAHTTLPPLCRAQAACRPCGTLAPSLRVWTARPVAARGPSSSCPTAVPGRAPSSPGAAVSVLRALDAVSSPCPDSGTPGPSRRCLPACTSIPPCGHGSRWFLRAVVPEAPSLPSPQHSEDCVTRSFQARLQLRGHITPTQASEPPGVLQGPVEGPRSDQPSLQVPSPRRCSDLGPLSK